MEHWGQCGDQQTPAGEKSSVPPLPWHRRTWLLFQVASQGQGPGLPMGGHAHLVELHVVVLDALYPGVLTVGANALSLLVP